MINTISAFFFSYLISLILIFPPIHDLNKSFWSHGVSDSIKEVAHEVGVPGRFITDGPSMHWFGYYDKLQMDPSGRYVLSNQTNFENRSPESSDRIRGAGSSLKRQDVSNSEISGNAANFVREFMFV